MPIIDRLLNLVGSLTLREVALGLVAVSAFLFVLQDRRLSLVPLLIQYVLLGLLIGSQFYPPLVVVRIALGVIICLILYITAGHVQRELYGLRPRLAEESDIWHTPPAPALRAISLAGMGSVFRLIVMAMGGLVAYGVWQAYPITLMPAEISLTSYWLIAIGLLMTLTSVDPLRMGFGLLTCINGFEGMYLFLEQSLVVIGLMGIINIVMTLGIAVCAETWLASFQEETQEEMAT